MTQDWRIECLNNQPGIYSARWAEQFGGFDNAMNEILKKVKKPTRVLKQDLLVA